MTFYSTTLYRGLELIGLKVRVVLGCLLSFDDEVPSSQQE